jgi:lipopolysaccharide/colanic/teichoic acid biosynthesis glycosyltransferase
MNPKGCARPVATIDGHSPQEPVQEPVCCVLDEFKERAILKMKPWNISKTAISGLPWSPVKRSGPVKVWKSPTYPVLPERTSVDARGDDDRPIDGLGDVQGVAPSPNRLVSWVKNFMANVVISPSFLLSSLLVFLFVPDAVLKGRLSLDLRARFTESVRRVIDFMGASVLIILLSPVFLVVPILIKLDSPGSVIYRQVRVGQNRRRWQRRRNPYRLKGDRRNGDRRREDRYGMLFVVYKFRSMREDAEKKSGPVWARQGDPRVTKVGRILRATRADELPQLFNILKGNMSLVGPRPERPYFVNRFVNNIRQYPDRLQVKPGLTGLAQVMGGYDTCMEDVCAKLQHDLRYIQKRSLGQDVKIILKTIGVVLTGKGVSE